MDMSRFRPESHVAQQSLRDKLRVPQSEDFPNSLNPDLVHVRSVRNCHLLYPDVISPGIFQVSSSSNVLQTAQEHRQMLSEAPSFSCMPQSNLSKFSAPSKVSGDPPGCGNWKSVGYASGLAGRGTIQDPRFLEEDESNTARESNICAATQYLKPCYGNLHFVSPSFYQNASQDVVTAASIGTQELEVASHEHQNVREANRGSRMNYSGNQANPLQFGDAGAWMNRRELGFLASKSSVELRTAESDVTTQGQGLSLSLSSNPTSKICGVDATQFSEDQYGYDGFNLRPAGFKEPQDSETLNPDNFCSMQKPSSTGKANGKSIQDAGATTSNYVHRQTTPLGPFTGYATILKNSSFLKPAQDLFDELFHFSNSKPFTVCDTSNGLSCYINALGSADAPNAVDLEAGTSTGNNSGSSSSTFYSFNESCRPEYQQKKAKLVHMLEEVCRRYKLYHQQMQMVVSSFESVAGLGAATPYFSLALKTVSKNFRCLRNAILDQIRHIARALGEDLLSPTTGTSSSKGDINMSMLKYVGQKSSGVNLGFLESQHGWRPQRGLPERAVAILRAWLFEHFLHPYPTDTDKHMLTIQTGLSRNQVSNWFINARVRVWKPMVEEIHMLESRGMAEVNQNLSKSDGKSISEGRNGWPNEEQSINRSCVNALSEKQLACSEMLVADIAGEAHDVGNWNHEKLSRMEFHIPTNMEGSMTGYEQSRLENGGIGAVSLTLGLRHGVESAQQQQRQYQQQEHHLRRQFGGQLIHDFAG